MGQAGSCCRRSAAETAGLSPNRHLNPEKPLSATNTAAAKNGDPAATNAAFVSGVQELRKLGIRPKMPGYNDTPLLTIGKQVRILKPTGFRKALIEYVNDDGTVDIAYEDGDKEDETVSKDLVRHLEGFEDPELDSQPKAKTATTEEKRQLGIRPNAPAYNDTPLFSIGKVVRVDMRGKCRRAVIEVVDDKEVDVAYRPYAEAWPGASLASKKGREPKEETVPKSAVKPLEEFECRKDNVWQNLFKDNFYGGITALKDGADELFIEVKDYDAALEYYSYAIDKFRDIRPSELNRVLFVPVEEERKDDEEECGPPREKVGLVLGRVNTVDVKTQAAFVAYDTPEGEEKIVRALFNTLTPVHIPELALQSSLYMNRARIFMQVERGVEAEKDLSIVVALWGADEENLSGTAKNYQLPKCHCLRSKIFMSRGDLGFARLEIKAALDMDPPEEISDIVWQLYREVEKELKDRKDKKDDKKDGPKKPPPPMEIGKFASSMSID